jgi:hypothetical protein
MEYHKKLFILLYLIVYNAIAHEPCQSKNNITTALNYKAVTIYI